MAEVPGAAVKKSLKREFKTLSNEDKEKLMDKKIVKALRKQLIVILEPYVTIYMRKHVYT